MTKSVSIVDTIYLFKLSGCGPGLDVHVSRPSTKKQEWIQDSHSKGANIQFCKKNPKTEIEKVLTVWGRGGWVLECPLRSTSAKCQATSENPDIPWIQKRQITISMNNVVTFINFN